MDYAMKNSEKTRMVVFRRFTIVFLSP